MNWRIHTCGECAFWRTNAVAVRTNETWDRYSKTEYRAGCVNSGTLVNGKTPACPNYVSREVSE